VDLTAFAEAIGPVQPVSITGLGTRGGAAAGTAVVRAPAGIESLKPEEMTIRCGAATPVDEVAVALAKVGQRVALPPGGTVGGALAVGVSGIRLLGDGPLRDSLLQARFVSAEGRVVTAGGPTVKNVSGFDLCRLLVGSRGTLGFLGEVTLRTRPMAAHSRWYRVPCADPGSLLARLYKPASVLWDGRHVWVLLEGHRADVEAAARAEHLEEVDGPPPLPSGRTVCAPSSWSQLRGRFVVQMGVGVVHGDCSAPPLVVDARAAELARHLKGQFDPTNRLNPGVDV
jgi:glycolate oxidase FAD binding subunit